MAQDLRKLMRNRPEDTGALPAGHEARFEARLAKEFGSEKQKLKSPWLQWAVAAVLIVGLGIFGWNNIGTPAIEGVEMVAVDNVTIVEKQVTMADISPELKQIENFYKTSINVAEVGPTEVILTAQIDNLKFRLELLFKLKEKLKELKNQNDEQFNSIQA